MLVAAAGRARRLGALGAGAWPWPGGGAARPRPRRRRPARARRRRGCGARLGGAAGLVLGLDGGAASAASSSALRFSSARRFSSSVCGLGLLLLAAARFLERGQAGFLGLAQQFLLQFLARGGVVDRPRGAASARARARARARPAAGAATGSGFGASASPGRPRMRRFLTSTTTVFERPWLKLCFTLPVSTVRLRPSGARVPSFGLSVVSLIRIPSSQISSADARPVPASRPSSPASRPIKARHRPSA